MSILNQNQFFSLFEKSQIGKQINPLLESLRPNHLYLVGGAVRNILLSIPTLDFDFVTEGPWDQVVSQVERCGLFEAIYENKKLKSLNFKFLDYTCNITHMRTEGPYIEGRRPSYVESCPKPEIEFKRRDFSINAIYADLNEKQLIDPALGLKSLEEKQIVMIGDPKTRIYEDPLRLLRGVRFACQLDFKLEPSLTRTFLNEKTLISQIPKPKAYEELQKILKIYDLTPNQLSLIKDLELFSHLFEEDINLNHNHLRHQSEAMRWVIIFRSLKCCDDTKLNDIFLKFEFSKKLKKEILQLRANPSTYGN